MGDLMRQYWIPALMTTECRLRTARPCVCACWARTSSVSGPHRDAVGIIQNACPHRGASLFFGRNEEDGLRCVYHGWKFDVSGACVDMPSEPAESNFKTKVHATAYPTEERNGIVWVYMGPREIPPPLPGLEAPTRRSARWEVPARLLLAAGLRRGPRYDAHRLSPLRRLQGRGHGAAVRWTTTRSSAAIPR